MSDRNQYKEARRNTRRSEALAQENITEEFVSELESTDGKKNVHRITKSRYSEYELCQQDPVGKTLIESDEIKEEWRSIWRNC